MKKTTSKFGFTLIELLVVIAIISLLAAMLFPAITAAITTAKKAKAKSICRNIEIAIMAYKNEYNGRLPNPNPSIGVDNTVGGGNEQFSKNILKILMAQDVNRNHKNIVFLETDIPTDVGEYLDPWGTQFQIILDLNGDKKISYLSASGAHHRKIAVVVSAGRNREWGGSTSRDDDNKDNLANVDLPLIN